MRIIIAGGGTGGHLFPGIALAQEFKRRAPDCLITFVGTSKGLENSILPKYGFPLMVIRCRGISHLGWMEKARAASLLPLAFLDAWRLLRSFKPHLVFGVGGYASGPLLSVASMLGMRGAILEQNLIPGFTNQILGRLVKKVFVSFPETIGYFPRGKAMLTGNPVREGIAPLPREKSGDDFNLLVLGGSQGARSLNEAFLAALEVLEPLKERLQIVHQTGETQAEQIARIYKERGVKAVALPFIEDIGKAYRQADLVVARAGATTVTELCVSGLPAILVPYPYAARDHQRFNALKLLQQGAAIMIEPKSLSGQTLAATIRELMGDRPKLEQMALQARRLARAQAAREIVDICLKWISA